MKQILSKSIKVLFLTLVVLAFTGCLKDDDIMTDGVRTGGLVKATANIPYKLGSTPTFDIDIEIGKGAAIKSIMVYKSFYHVAGDVTSNRILFETIDVASANESAGIVKTLTYDWTDLLSGLVVPGYTIPADEMLSDIGDSFTFDYVAVMASDDKEIINLRKTSVAIANFFAGTYDVSGYFFHPTASRDIAGEKDLVATSPIQCRTLYADFGDGSILLVLNIDPITYAVTTTSVGPYPANPGTILDPTHVNSYDPVTGIIEVWYYYVGGSGNRIIHEIYTPK